MNEWCTSYEYVLSLHFEHLSDISRFSEDFLRVICFKIAICKMSYEMSIESNIFRGN